ncbi:MAG: threonine synthase [Pseudomonadota bacterium]
MAEYVTELECSLTGKRYPARAVHGLSEEGRPLLVRYDLERLTAEVPGPEVFAAAERPAGFWRFRELLPILEADAVPDLGEMLTPLIRLDALGAGGPFWVKDEGRLPTGSFKARGLGVAVAMAWELGLEHLAMPTNGNAGAALAAYCARAGLRASVFCPADTPEINIAETAMLGADVFRVDGLINDCGRLVGELAEERGWFDLSTLKEPYRIEGKKTMGLELAEQFAGRLPDAIFYPTGGGTGLIGMWKAFAELEALGWLAGQRGPGDPVKKPKMFAVQAEGCAPIVRAFEAGEEHAPVWENASTVAAGIRVPVAVGDFLIIRAVRESGGAALAVSDEAILEARRDIARRTGNLLCPEGAATYAGWQQALEQGFVAAEDEVVLFNCATGLIYPLEDGSRPWSDDT